MLVNERRYKKLAVPADCKLFPFFILYIKTDSKTASKVVNAKAPIKKYTKKGKSTVSEESHTHKFVLSDKSYVIK